MKTKDVKASPKIPTRKESASKVPPRKGEEKKFVDEMYKRNKR